MDVDYATTLPPQPSTPRSGSRSRLHLLLSNDSLSHHPLSPMHSKRSMQCHQTPHLNLDMGMQDTHDMTDPASSPSDTMSTAPDFEWGADLETPPRYNRHSGPDGSPMPVPRSPLQPIANLFDRPIPESPHRGPVSSQPSGSTPVRFCRRSSTIVLQKKPATPRTLLHAISRRAGMAHVPTAPPATAVNAPANVNPFTSRTESTLGPKRSVVERLDAPYHPVAAKVRGLQNLPTVFSLHTLCHHRQHC
jgi:hypothetical protein